MRHGHLRIRRRTAAANRWLRVTTGTSIRIEPRTKPGVRGAKFGASHWIDVLKGLLAGGEVFELTPGQLGERAASTRRTHAGAGVNDSAPITTVRIRLDGHRDHQAQTAQRDSGGKDPTRRSHG